MGGQNILHWPKSFYNFDQNLDKIMVRRVFTVFPHPQYPLLKPFLAMPLVSYTFFYFKLLFIVVEANILD